MAIDRITNLRTGRDFSAKSASCRVHIHHFVVGQIFRYLIGDENQKIAFFDGVSPLARRPIVPAGPKFRTAAKPSRVAFTSLS